MPPVNAPAKPTPAAQSAPAQPAPQKATQEANVNTTVSSESTPKSTQDILKNIAEVPAPAQTPSDDGIFSTADLKAEIERIQDPNQKKMLEGVYKNMESGLNKKFMALSDKMKEYDKKMAEQTQWTPDRVKQATSDPNFLTAAQAYMQEQERSAPPANFNGNSSDWSALSDSDKAYIRSLDSKITELSNENRKSALLQGDQEIKQRIPTYDPQEVDRLQGEISSGRWTQAQIREALWKAANFDKVVQQTYQYARQDRSGDIKEKMAASSFSGTSTNTQSDLPPRREGESAPSWFKRIAEFRLQEARAQKRV